MVVESCLARRGGVGWWGGGGCVRAQTPCPPPARCEPRWATQRPATAASRRAGSDAAAPSRDSSCTCPTCGGATWTGSCERVARTRCSVAFFLRFSHRTATVSPTGESAPLPERDPFEKLPSFMSDAIVLSYRALAVSDERAARRQNSDHVSIRNAAARAGRAVPRSQVCIQGIASTQRQIPAQYRKETHQCLVQMQHRQGKQSPWQPLPGSDRTPYTADRGMTTYIAALPAKGFDRFGVRSQALSEFGPCKQV
jgi:hypothetical protein